jgi:phenylalanyl-tRNA synthetase beta chain
MKIPLSWLKEFIDLNVTPDEIAKTLTLLGLEVDGVEIIGGSFSNVVVAEVLEVEKHPNADRLRVAKVTDGSGTWQVVCGAPNCRQGIKSAFARVGAVLEDDEGKKFKVKQCKIRNVESNGMLCSLKELKLGEDHEGIIEFEGHIPLGTNVAGMYGDAVFELIQKHLPEQPP